MTRTGNILVTVKRAAKEKYAWPGGYPMYIVMDDGEALCCDCANKELGRIAGSTARRDQDGWAALGVDINWEDSSLFCCHCNARIESAYAEDEA